MANNLESMSFQKMTMVMIIFIILRFTYNVNKGFCTHTQQTNMWKNKSGNTLFEGV